MGGKETLTLALC